LIYATDAKTLGYAVDSEEEEMSGDKRVEDMRSDGR
jgi:hypothetical protein